MSTKRSPFLTENDRLTKDVVGQLQRAQKQTAVIAEAPPGAGKSTLTTSVAASLLGHERKLRLAIVTQTNEQSDDLVVAMRSRYPEHAVARMVGGSGPSEAIDALQKKRSVIVCTQSDNADALKARVIVSTARKWQYERSRLQDKGKLSAYPIALIDEA